MSMRVFRNRARSTYLTNFRNAQTQRNQLMSQVRSARGAPYRRGGRGSVLRFYRGLANRDYRFTVNATPFNIIFNSGTALGAGMGYYTEGAIPAVPAGSGNFLQFGFQLDSVVYAFAAGGAATAANIPNVSEYVALFEMWQLEAVEATMVYSNAPNIPGAAIPAVPTISTIFDPDDMDNFSYGTMQQSPYFKVTQFGNSSGAPGGKQVQKFYPKYSPRINLASGGTTIWIHNREWIDTGTTDARLFGWKWYYNNEDNQARYSYQGYVTVFFKYFLKFKTPK